MLVIIANCLLLSSTRPLVRRPTPSLLRDRPATWSNPDGAVLTQIHDDVWLAERPFYPTLPGLQGTDVGCKMCVIRLPDGTLWVHAPVGLDDALRKALAELGEVRHIVTPNTEHQKWAPLWILEYPEASSYACPGLKENKPEVGWERSLEFMCDLGVTASMPPAEWGGVLQLCWIKDRIPLTSIPFFNEVVFVHIPSRTLIVTDLWWNYPATPDVPLSSKVWKMAMDVIYRPVYNRLMHGPNWEESYNTIMQLDFDYIAPCHGDPVATGGKQILARHLAMLG